MDPLESRQPLVVATISRTADLECLREEVPALIDLFEFRLDNLAADLDAAFAVAEGLRGRILITARHPEEGGAAESAGTEERLAWLERFLPLAAWMDLELRTLGTSEEAVALARRAREAGVRVVGSFHDFGGMPADAVLARKLAEGIELGLDAVKLAVRMEKLEDLFALGSMVLASPLPVAAMGMGPVGKLSRLVLARAGSILNYGYLTVPNAPGQWAAPVLKELLGEICENACE